MPKIPEFVPDEALLWFIDELGGDVVRWRADPQSTEAYPLVHIEVNPDGE